MLSAGEPGQTPYDLRFTTFGFPVRVSAWFWLAAVIFGQSTAALGIPVLLMWVAAMFLSVLVHELGHTFAFRQCGISSHIVLYHFGGLAIPDSHRAAWTSSTRRDDPRTSIFISAAGPALEILSAIGLIVVLNLAGYSVPIPRLVAFLVPEQTGEILPNKLAFFFIAFYIEVSIYWGLLNLLPVFPMDGGKIARSLMQMFLPLQAVPYSLMLSIGVGGLIAIYALQSDRMYLAFMFGYLAYMSYQQLQLYQGPRGRW